MDDVLADLRHMRRPLLMLATLFFAILLVEINLEHRPALTSREAGLALLPLLWLPLALLALMALQIKASHLAATVIQTAMAVAAVIGLIGFFAHLGASGVTLDQPQRLFSPALWGGAASPDWPIAITLAAVLGFIGAYGSEDGAGALRADPSGVICAVSFALILAGIVLSITPGMLAESAFCLVLAALLLLAALLALLATSVLAGRTA